MEARQQLVDQLKQTKFPVLSDGFIRLVDVMGSDSTICDTARLTSGSSGKDDRGLLRYLIRHEHSTPIQFGDIVLHLRVPMDVMRQWARHRTWTYLTINEHSTRYSPAIDAMDTTEPTAWRKQAQSNRQGSEGLFDEDIGRTISHSEVLFHDAAKMLYKNRLTMGIAREQARKDLPLSTYTELQVKVDLGNMMHFLALRMDHGAQQEIRECAVCIADNIVKPLFPLCFEAFVDYKLEAKRLTRLDCRALKGLFNPPKTSDAIAAWCMANNDNPEKRSRERDEFVEKLVEIGIVLPD